MQTETPKLSRGILGYLDTFAGLIPCRVVAVKSRSDVQVKLTANRGAYRRGEVLESTASLVVPRGCVHVRCGQYRIRYYDVVLDANAE